MARISHVGGSRRLSRQARSLQEERSFQLETQLFQVIERDGVRISTPLLQEADMSQRAKRGIRRRARAKVSQEARLETKLITDLSSGSPVHPITVLDQVLLASIQAQRAVTSQTRSVDSPARLSSAAVPVRFSEHAPSDHVLAFHVPARPMIQVARDPFGQTVGEWVAPYQIPPSVEGMVAATQDLWIEEVDPRLFLEQFTPGEAQVAYAQRYHLLSKLIAPFIKWEVVEESASNSSTQVDDRVSLLEVESMPAEVEERGVVPQPFVAVSVIPESEALPLEDAAHNFRLVEEQFTPVDADDAYRGSYGLLARLKRQGARLLALFDRTVKDVEHQVVERVEVVEEEVEEVVQEVRETWSVPVLVPRLHTIRVMVGFIALLLIVSIPAGAVSLSRSFGSSVHDAKAQSAAALTDVQNALQGSGADQLQAWAQASERFGRAQESLLRANALALGLARALPQTRAQYDSVQALLVAGERTSQAAKLLVGGLSRALDDKNRLRTDERIGIFLTYVDYASPLMEEAVQALDTVQPDSLPLELRARVTELRSMVGHGQASFQDAKTLLEFLQAALGHEASRTYLFVFQNHAELRPTGGFMGSIAEVTFDRGDIHEIRVPGGGPYDLRTQLRRRVAPPGPLQLVGGRWEFQDANWFPDFPASADKIRWFWSQAGQPTLDGVIAINDRLLEQLLRVTGPIEMPEYGKTLTADNVIFELQKSVELEYDKAENKPKKIIGDLMPKLLARLKGGSREDWLALAELGLQALETKDVQVWMTRPEEEQLVERYDWNGRLKPTLGDALAIIEANIAGQKTDASIREQVDHQVEIAEDGSITDTVTLTRTHDAIKGELFKGANNVSYLRVYVPLGSRLLEADGFEAPSSSLFEIPLAEDLPDADVARLVKDVESPIASVAVTHEFGRTAFGGWVQLRPGETRVTRFRYVLPFTAFDLAERTGEGQRTDGGALTRAAYLLLLTSQSGASRRTIHTHVQLPQAWRTKWTTPVSDTPMDYQALWDRDAILAGLFDARP